MFLHLVVGTSLIQNMLVFSGIFPYITTIAYYYFYLYFPFSFRFLPHYKKSIFAVLVPDTSLLTYLQTVVMHVYL
jgi:hypothetical protein